MIGLKSQTVLQMISVADIGKYGLIAFEQHDKLNGEAIDIAADAKTMPETAEILGKAMGKSVRFALPTHLGSRPAPRLVAGRAPHTVPQTAGRSRRTGKFKEQPYHPSGPSRVG